MNYKKVLDDLKEFLQSGNNALEIFDRFFSIMRFTGSIVSENIFFTTQSSKQDH